MVKIKKEGGADDDALGLGAFPLARPLGLVFFVFSANAKAHPLPNPRHYLRSDGRSILADQIQTSTGSAVGWSALFGFSLSWLGVLGNIAP